MPDYASRFVTPLPELPASLYTLTTVRGVRAAGVRAGIKPSGRPDVAVLAFDQPAACAGVFTQNKLAAAPVVVSREHLASSGGRVRAVVVNSGNANACTGTQGQADARAMCAQVARGLACDASEVLVCSTGVIGVKLPMDNVRAGIDACLGEIASDHSRETQAGRRFLQAIMTTDAFPKESAIQIDLVRAGPADGQTVTVAGVCKGAGMIHPNMATLLAFMATDAAFTPQELASAMPTLADRSFNSVHVDTHPSTNDTFLLFSTGQTTLPAAWPMDRFFGEALAVPQKLAWLIARDGEGATKVTTIDVRGARHNAAAREVAEWVAKSALVRSALFGNDPNWGRFVSQVGNCPAVHSVAGLRCVLQDIVVFENGEPTTFDRKAASQAMRAEDVHLLLELGEGAGQAFVMTSDLSYKYVEINAEYTT